MRGGALNVAGAFCSQVAVFAITTILARSLGDDAVGRYALCFAVLWIVGFIALFGAQRALIRFVAMALADDDHARLRGLLRFVIGGCMGLAVVIAVGIALGAHHIGSLVGIAGFEGDLRLVALALPATVLRDSCLAATQGWRSQKAYAAIFLVVEPMIRLLLTVVALSAGWGLRGALGALVLGAWTAALLAVLALRRRLRDVRTGRGRYPRGVVLRFSVVALGGELASTGLIWGDTLLLGALRGAQDVGVYNVSTRLVNLAIFLIGPVAAAFSPQFARLIHRGDTRGLGAVYTAATTWITRASLPAFVLLLIFPRDLLSWFGTEFRTGVSVTLILLAGQLVNALTGPGGALLGMSGRNSLNLVNNLATLVLNIGLNLILIPRHGIVGAALAWSISLAVVNLARLVQVAVVFSVLPFGRGAARAGVAAGIAAIAAIVVREVLSAGIERALIGAVVIGVVYLAVMAAMGFDQHDRQVAADVRQRWSRAG